MVKNTSVLMLMAILVFAMMGCNIVDIPPAHKGRVFEQSMVGSSDGFIGNILGPGSQSIGVENEIFMVQCSESTTKEAFPSPAKDGVEFTVDVYVRFSANCDEAESVKWILSNVQPNPDVAKSEAARRSGNTEKDGEAATESGVFSGEYMASTVTAYQLYRTYLRSTIGMAVRDVIAGYNSDEILVKRAKVGEEVAKAFTDKLAKVRESSKRPLIISIGQLDVSKITPPKSMQTKMTELANKKTELKIEEEEKKKVALQIKTEEQRKALAEAKAKKTSTEIDEIGAAIKRNPAYFEYRRMQNERLMIQNLPEAMKGLGQGGGTIVFGSSNGLNMFLPTGKPASK